MIHYQKPAELYDGLRLHQNENTGGCSPRVLEALRTLRADQIGFYPPYAATIEACARYLGVAARLGRARQRPRRRDHRRSPSPTCDRRPAASCRKRSCRNRHSRSSSSTPKSSAAGRCASCRAPISAFRSMACSPPSRRDTRVVFLTNPNNPTGRVDAAGRDSHDRRRGAGRGDRVRGRGVRRVLRRRRSFPSCRRFPTSSSAGRSRRRSAWPACGSAVWSAPPTGSIRFGSRFPSTASTSPRSSPCAPRSRIGPTSTTTVRQVAESKALLYAACDRLGLTYWKSGANFVLVSAGDRTAELVAGRRRRAASTFAIARPNRAAPAASASAPASSSTRAAASPRSKRCYAPRGDRSANHRDADRAVDRRSTARAPTRCGPASGFWITCWSWSRATARFDLRIEATGDLDVDQHHTVEDLGIALGEAVSKALGDRRGINRAGYFVMPMDETLAVAAIDLGGRPHAVVDLKTRVRARRRSADRARPRFLRRLRDGRARQRPRQGAVRALEPPSRRSGVQGVRPRAARRVREGPAPGAHAAEHEGIAVSRAAAGSEC